MGDLRVWPEGWGATAGVAGPREPEGPPVIIGCIAGAAMSMGVGADDCRLMRTFSSPSVISISPMPDSWTRSISFLSFRRSISAPFSTCLLLHLAQRRFQGQFVDHGTQSGDDASGQVREIRVVPER